MLQHRSIKIRNLEEYYNFKEDNTHIQVYIFIIIYIYIYTFVIKMPSFDVMKRNGTKKKIAEAIEIMCKLLCWFKA